MRTRRNGTWLALLIASIFISEPTAMAADVWGKTVNGLQMSLAAPSADDITLSLRNTSGQDKMLSIGIMLAPSVNTVVKGKATDVATARYQYPEAVTLSVQDASGKATEFSIKGPPGVAGSIEPMEVPLPPGATYSFRTPLSEIIDQKNFAAFPKGDLQITARYKPEVGRSRANRHYWTGSLQSNKVSIKR